MPVFPYRPCDLRHDPLSCFVYPDILNRLDQALIPIVSEAAQNTIPPPRKYEMQFVVNPVAGGGRVGSLIEGFQRRAMIEPWLRVLGGPIQTSPSVDSMTKRFSSAHRLNGWGDPFYLPILSGDSGLSKAMDALSRLHDKTGSHAVVIPVNGVGTARDIPRVAGAPSFTERLPHALVRSVDVPYYGVDVAGEVGAGRHFHSIAFGVGGKLFQIVNEVVERHPILLRLKKLSGAFGVLPYLAAFAPLVRMVRGGELVTEVEVTQGDEVLFRGRTCGIITAIVPAMGSVTRIPGVDPTHGQVRVIILPENAVVALKVILEGMWLQIKSVIPGTRMPDLIASLPADRQIPLGRIPIQLRFGAPSPMEANGDYIGEATALTMQVADKPTVMAVNRNSLLAALDGYQQSEPTFESVLRVFEMAMIGAGLVGALLPRLKPEDYRDLTHKLMVGMVHATTIAVMLRNGSPLAFHVRLLSLLPAFMGLQKAGELLPITDKKWQIFAQNYLPLAVIGVMQYFRVTPTMGNVVRLVAPRVYSAIMGGRLATGIARSALGHIATSTYYVAYVAGMIVYFYQAIGDLGERNQVAASWLESTLQTDTPDGLALWGRDVLRRMDAEPQAMESMTMLPHLPREDVEESLKQALPAADWTRLDELAGHMQRLDLAAVLASAQRERSFAARSSSFVTTRAWMMAARIDPDRAYWKDALLHALMQHDTEIVSAAKTPGFFVLAATLAFHRRHSVPQFPEPQFLPALLAALTLDDD